MHNDLKTKQNTLIYVLNTAVCCGPIRFEIEHEHKSINIFYRVIGQLYLTAMKIVLGTVLLMMWCVP